MRSSSKNYINLRKVGGFYQCFDEDAYLLFYLFGYKVNNDRAGFPISSLNKIINTLDNKKINYMVCNNNDDKSIKDFKRKNTYYHYVEVSKEAYNLEIKKLSIEKKIKSMPFSKIEKLYAMIEQFVNE